jgi:hypothetical protein
MVQCRCRLVGLTVTTLDEVVCFALYSSLEASSQNLWSLQAAAAVSALAEVPADLMIRFSEFDHLRDETIERVPCVGFWVGVLLLPKRFFHHHLTSTHRFPHSMYA